MAQNSKAPAAKPKIRFHAWYKVDYVHHNVRHHDNGARYFDAEHMVDACNQLVSWLGNTYRDTDEKEALIGVQLTVSKDRV